jgi:LPPG:FO 2-phospho-L-lactate transferase
MSRPDPPARVLALCGGVGGAKLALGLARVMAPEALDILINTGDDFEHLGLHVSPDIDTVLYTLAGLSNPIAGWGRADETWTFLQALEALGGETWFRLGDGDLATHVERTRRLKAGETLSTVTADFARRLGIGPRLLPMSDDPVRTIVQSDEGPLPFQHYFVRRRCEPRALGFAYEGAAMARPGPAVLAALADPGLGAIVICPSNPYLSVAPILALPALREALGQAAAPIVAVSPIIGGRAVKGPAAKIMAELGLAPTAAAVAQHYRGLIDGFVLDEEDAGTVAELPTLATPILMTSLAERETLARRVLAFAARLERRPERRR